MGVWYATREDVQRALDSKETARNSAQVDRAIEAASRSVEALCHRTFAPTLATRYFDWPNSQSAAPERLWLDANELISVSTVSSGGVAISTADVLLEPNQYGPPYNRIELNLGTNAAFGGGDTHQRDITITGLYGYRNDETSAGATTGSLDASTTSVGVNAAASAALGVGSVLRVDDERMLITRRTMADTSQTLGANLDAQAKTVTVPVGSGAAFAVDEVILIDAERMLVVDIAGTNLIVKRAWDGSVLAAHTSSTAVYALRTLTVTRGALGTTAATHSSGATVHRWDPPGPVRQLTIAEAMRSLQSETAGYATIRRVNEGERLVSNADLADLRASTYTSHGRKARIRGV